MKWRNLALVLMAATAVLGLGAGSRTPVPPAEPTMLSLRVGQSFGEVVGASSYPVVQRSIVPNEETNFSGGTYVHEPAVALCFNDPLHGFILPPTKFALVTYAHNVVATISTSPMPDKLPFDKAVAILEDLQHQFKAGGWEPQPLGAGNKWFDLTPEGKKRLYQRMFEPGYSQTVELRIPKKYGMTFRLKCTDGCWPDEKPPHRFLIDVSVGMDMFGSEPGDPDVWDKSFLANQPSTEPARFRCPASPSH